MLTQTQETDVKLRLTVCVLGECMWERQGGETGERLEEPSRGTLRRGEIGQTCSGVLKERLVPCVATSKI